MDMVILWQTEFWKPTSIRHLRICKFYLLYTSTWQTYCIIRFFCNYLSYRICNAIWLTEIAKTLFWRFFFFAKVFLNYSCTCIWCIAKTRVQRILQGKMFLMACEFYGICYLSTNGQKVLVMRIEWRMAIKKIWVINPELDC